MWQRNPSYNLLGDLLRAGWVRTYIRRHQILEDMAVVRIYVLPDDAGRRYLERDQKKARKALMNLMTLIDRSYESWDARNVRPVPKDLYMSAQPEDDSLFYLFNTLASPVPSPSEMSCSASRDAVYSLLDDSTAVQGLKTKLYPYQKRSAATMIRREAEPARALDPRLETLEGPTGQAFYYDRETGVLLRDKREYDEARGGILAETMGLGKTLICLAAVLATKGHWPKVPPEYSLGLHPVRSKTGTLMQMVAASIGREQIPWRRYFQELSDNGDHHESCSALLEENIGSYVIPAPVPRRSRQPLVLPPGQRIRLCTATLIIVPSNLIMQWQNEITSHLNKDALKVLLIDSLKQLMPPADELLRYDIILISKQVFEREIPDNEMSSKKRRSSSTKTICTCPFKDGCNCFQTVSYNSPLKDLHFLRIIVDEGHGFAPTGSKTNAINVLQNLHVDRRWIVSGTPAPGLLGVEVGTAVNETLLGVHGIDLAANRDTLRARRKESALIQERRDLERLGRIVVDFLNLRPWANGKGGEDPASWPKYVMPFEDGRRKARSLQKILESLVVRHRIEDIEVDLQLPPLHNRIVYLQPSWHDKLSINMFILVLVVNAVTSERIDQDYMFHHKNKAHLHRLISNLRHSGFYWTGFPSHDISESLRFSRAYLERNHLYKSDAKEIHDTITHSGSYDKLKDRYLLQEAIRIGTIALQSPSWIAFSRLHELGVFVEAFPDNARNTWSLLDGQTTGALLVGATQLEIAQQFVNKQLYASDPANGLAAAGETAMQKAWQQAQTEPSNKKSKAKTQTETDLEMSLPKGIPRSSFSQEKQLQEKKHTMSKARLTQSPRKIRSPPKAQVPKDLSKSTNLKSALKPSSTTTVPGLPPTSSLNKTQLCGTASAKLSYLLDRVIALHESEKILIFYEAEHIAYYIAQVLELIDVRFLIYAKTLTVTSRNSYIATFNTTETFRVLLMDVQHAAHGLHIASASRVFFVNPVWQPNVEAQAIKRAHRIGQTRPVYVETLVLKDTLEDQMLQRRKGMTAQEHQKAEKSLLDDSAMRNIIENARFIPLTDKESLDVNSQIARLQSPQQVFGRTSKGTVNTEYPDADLILPGESSTPKTSDWTRKRKASSGEMILVESDLLGSTKPKRRKAPKVSIKSDDGATVPCEQSASAVHFAAGEMFDHEIGSYPNFTISTDPATPIRKQAGSSLGTSASDDDRTENMAPNTGGSSSATSLFGGDDPTRSGGV